jgi:hypothetical protein
VELIWIKRRTIDKGIEFCCGSLCLETYHFGDYNLVTKPEIEKLLSGISQESIKIKKTIMAQYTRIQVAQIMKEAGFLPLFYHKDIE